MSLLHQHTVQRFANVCMSALSSMPYTPPAAAAGANDAQAMVCSAHSVVTLRQTSLRSQIGRSLDEHGTITDIIVGLATFRRVKILYSTRARFPTLLAAISIWDVHDAYGAFFLPTDVHDA
jgi:hypothetical protein